MVLLGPEGREAAGREVAGRAADRCATDGREAAGSGAPRGDR